MTLPRALIPIVVAEMLAAAHYARRRVHHKIRSFCTLPPRPPSEEDDALLYGYAWGLFIGYMIGYLSASARPGPPGPRD